YVLDAVAGDRILFVGANQVVEEIAEHIATHRELGLSVVGYLIDGAVPGSSRTGAKVLGPVSDLNKIATEMRPSRIGVGMAERRGSLPVRELLELRFAGFGIEEAGSTYEAVCGR